MDVQRGVKRVRKRKSLLKKAEKYGKKGKFGRGTHLSEDVYQYLVRVLELLDANKFENEEEKVIFTNNVFDEILNEEVNYSCNQFASAVLEKLLPTASDTVLKRFMKEFGENLRPICCDPYGSYVLQKLLVTASQRGLISGTQTEETECTLWFIKVSKFVLNNLEDFVWDTCANHVIRTVIECLAGISSGTAVNYKKHVKPKMKIATEPSVKLSNISPEYTDLLKEFVHRLSAWPQFQDLAFSNLTSGLLQTLLFATKKCDNKLTQKLISKLLDECFTVGNESQDALEEHEDKSNIPDKQNILPVFENAAVVCLLEAAIVNASPKKFTQIYAKCFINHLAVLSQHCVANFSVKKLLDYCTEKNEFEGMFNELEGHVEEILKSHNTGIILSLAQACKRHSANQGRFEKTLMKALHCLEPKERQAMLAPLTLGLVTYEEQASSNKVVIQLNGSLILETLLNFNKPIKAVNSLLDMNTGDLKSVLTDQKGCHIMDAFMKSEFVGEKSRDKIIKKLQGLYVTLACTKYGSRSLDAMWNVANLKQKILIMDELSAKEPILNSGQYGSILATNYCLSLYRYNPNEWKDLQGKEFRKKKLFADIIGDTRQSS